MMKAKKIKHDTLASIRFLENLHSEIKNAQNIEEINDPLILEKFLQIISILKKQLKIKN